MIHNSKPGTVSLKHRRRSTMSAEGISRLSLQALTRVISVVMVCLGIYTAQGRAEEREKFDVFSLSYTDISEKKLDDQDAGTYGVRPKLAVGTLEARVNVPTLLSQGNTVLIHSLAYNRLKFNWQEAGSGDSDPAYGVNGPDALHGIDYQLAIMRRLNDKWSMVLAFRPGLYSDFDERLSSDDFKIEAAIFFDRRYSERAVLGFGLAYSTTFESLVLPVLHLKNSSESAFNVDLFLPFEGKLTYKVGAASEIGLAGKVEGNRYHLNQTAGSAVADNADILRYSVGTVGPHATINLSGPCYVVFDAGTTFRRRFEFYRNDTKTSEIDLGNSWFARAGLKISL